MCPEIVDLDHCEEDLDDQRARQAFERDKEAAEALRRYKDELLPC